MPKPRPPGLDRAHSHAIIKCMSRANTWLYRVSGGKVGSRFLAGAPVLLLTTTGRKSGLPRTQPVLYLVDEDRLVIVASKAGMAKHPMWYLNLCATPAVQVEVGDTATHYEARTADADEKAELWPRLVAMYPDFDSYQSWTERDIPVVILEPSPSPSST